jgi:hypothetical protein
MFLKIELLLASITVGLEMGCGPTWDGAEADVNAG